MKKIDPRKIVVYRSSAFLSIVGGGVHRRFKIDEIGEDWANEIYRTAKSFKEERDSYAEAKLLQYLDPDYRRPVDGENGMLVRDIWGRMYYREMPHLPIEKAIVDLIRKYREEGTDITPVINLWKWSLDNPSEQARRDLMAYIERFGIPVTDSGYMILYKAVRTKDEVIGRLSYLVGQEFFELRRTKKDPKEYNVFEVPEGAVSCIGEEDDLPYKISDEKYLIFPTEKLTFSVPLTEDEEKAVSRKTVYVVCEDDVEVSEFDNMADAEEHLSYLEMEDLDDLDDSPYSIRINRISGRKTEDEMTRVEAEPLGNLHDLFNDLVLSKKDVDPTEEEKQPVWMPYHHGTHGMEIRLGKVVTMPRDECDPDITRDCSFGLHVGSYEYVSTFGSKSGDTLACLVNPRDIVALPEYDHSKIRCCAYMPYGIIKKDEEGNWEEAETTHWEEDFASHEIAELEKRVAELQEIREGDPGWARAKELMKLAEDRLRDFKSTDN